MSMFNFDGQIVADALHAQQIGDFCRDLIRDRAAISAGDLQQELIALHQRYEQLVGRYNNLADRYNDLLEENKRFDAAHADAIATKDGQIAQLVAANERLAAEREESRRSAYEGWTKLTRALEEIERLKIKAGELAPDERKPDVDL